MDYKRNLKSLDNKTGQKIKTQINNVIGNCEKYKGCYFWTNTGNANNRRRQEFDINFSFILNNNKYEVSQSLSISCKNFYFQTSIIFNGKKSNIKRLKNLI